MAELEFYVADMNFLMPDGKFVMAEINFLMADGKFVRSYALKQATEIW